MKKQRMPIFYPLFHGANTKALNMSQEERKKMYTLCLFVARTSYDFLINKYIVSKNKDVNVLKENTNLLIQSLKDNNKEQYTLAKTNIDNLFSDIEDKESIVTAIRFFYYLNSGNNYFEYGDKYLTLDINRAKEYALNGTSFGEISVIANNLFTQAKHDGLLNELKEEDKIKINAFVEEIKNTGDPVVLKYECIYEDELLHENGDEVTEEEWERYANSYTYPNGFRVKKDVNIEDRLKDKIKY